MVLCSSHLCSPHAVGRGGGAPSLCRHLVGGRGLNRMSKIEPGAHGSFHQPRDRGGGRAYARRELALTLVRHFKIGFEVHAG